MALCAMMVAEGKRAHSRQEQNYLFANPRLCSLSSVNISLSSSPGGIEEEEEEKEL